MKLALKYLLVILFIFCAVVFIPKPIEKAQLTDDLEIATLAGGCFWCVEADIEKVPGVIEVISGFSGGEEINPTYKQVASGATGHRESVQVYYDPTKTTYKTILDTFWKTHDPTDAEGQFVDRGFQYSPAIYYHNEEQQETAEETKAFYQQYFNQTIATEIVAYSAFYEAEEYHQDYYKKNEARYSYYRYFSGRDQFVKETWENITFKKLTPLQYRVTQLDETEPAFDNEYWDNKEPGIYVDIIDGTPLFSSVDKFQSGTGWPSFFKPISEGAVVEKTDYKLVYPRTEIRSASSDAHLGHVFDDGPNDTLRYCMNSAALEFTHKDDLEARGYEEYLTAFE